ncbi:MULTISPECIES: energy transducer TonB [unclassified Roseovarius]|uniref:energy transducer TonB n=1 Tax=unclassified Roseovarius TaxID=2614913 RepID=UPI00273F003F|nr:MULTISPECIES: energy transducer TonB [unclassified Roseovarius]
MNTGQIISGAGHLALIGWALFGGVFKSEPLPFEVTEVTAISGDEYAALVAPQSAPETAVDVTSPEAPDIDDSAPDLGSGTDVQPEVAQPDVAATPPPDERPEVTEVMPPADAEVSDEPPEITPPSEDVAVLAPEVAPEAQPREADRVAPEPVAQPEPDAQIDDIVQPETVPDEAAETPREETDATAPEEATTEIVTEAEEPAQAAPSKSLRPQTRPERPAEPEPVETAQPQEPAETETQTDESAVNDALAEALGGGGASETETSTPSGPPLTRGEKDALRVAVKQCWNVGSLSTDALQVTVVVGVTLDADGKPTSIQQLSATGGSGGAVSKAYEAARRAVLRCGAKGFDLPRDKYDHWRDIEMTFNPEKMRIK